MTDDERKLERLLDETARQLRPSDPGWERLAERLGPQDTAGAPLEADQTPDEAAGRGPSTTKPATHATGRRAKRVGTAVAVVAAIIVVALVLPALFSTTETGQHDNTRMARDDRPQPQDFDVPTTIRAPLGRPDFVANMIAVEPLSIEVTVFNPIQMSQPTLYMPVAGTANVSSPIASQQRQFTGGFQSVAPPSQGFAVSGRRFGRPQPQTQSPQGMALVKDRRMMLRLGEGDNLVKFTDVAATIDPTSVQLTSETDPNSLVVVEQNFEFDLASADAILERFVGSEHRVRCISEGEGQVSEGFLLSFDATELVLGDRLPDAIDADAPRPRTETIARAGLKAIRFEQLPEGLYVRPTLVWRLRSKKPGDHRALLTYLCGRMSWQADYVVSVRESDPEAGDTLDLRGWVTIDNRSGTTYDDSGIKLIAGDVNRVPDPWAAALGFGGVSRWNFSFGPPQLRGGGFGGGGGKEFIQREFFEYKLYELNQPSTIRDSQIKQLGLLKAEGVKATRRYRYDPQLNASRAMVELVVDNSEENHLGRPLPKGRVILTARDSDDESHLIGRDQIDHTPKDEELELTVGAAFDVVGQFRTVTLEQRVPGRPTLSYEITVRNHKPHAIDVRAVGHLQSGVNWKIIETNTPYTKHDFQTVYFNFRLDADSERVIRYTVDYERPEELPESIELERRR